MNLLFPWLRTENENTVWLEDFCILPNMQNKGYGTKTLKLIESLLEDRKTLKLSTPCFCYRNRHLYEKNGFAPIGFESNSTVIVYQKRLLVHSKINLISKKLEVL